jgi:hypothetical protein
MPHRYDEEQETHHRHRTFTKYVVLSDGKTYDILADCQIIEVPDDVDDVDGYIRRRLHNQDHPSLFPDSKL